MAPQPMNARVSMVVGLACCFVALVAQVSPRATSPRLRGEVAKRSLAGEGELPRVAFLEVPPHPPCSLRSQVDLSPQAGRGEERAALCCYADFGQRAFATARSVGNTVSGLPSCHCTMHT